MASPNVGRVVGCPLPRVGNPSGESAQPTKVARVIRTDAERMDVRMSTSCWVWEGELYALTALRMILSFLGVICMCVASSSTLGARPSVSSSSRLAYLSLPIISTMYAGMWIGCTLLINARLIACLIHHDA